MQGSRKNPAVCYDELTEYVIENQDKFYRLAFSFVRTREDALDVVQNAICKALDYYGTLRNKGAVKTWFYRILVNESLLFLKKRREELLPEEQLIENIPYYEKEYEPRENLYEQINRLPPDIQMVIKLRFYEEFSLKEIAVIMKMNLNTVKTKLYRGLKLLKQTMEVKV